MWLIRLFLLSILFVPLAFAQTVEGTDARRQTGQEFLARASGGVPPIPSTFPARGVWRFAVSGDSRNCGDLVMPVIAQRVIADDVLFYWHLGDFRAIYKNDEDYEHTHPRTSTGTGPTPEYLANAWKDFIDSQLAPFGDLPVFLSFGNHENISPKDHNQVIAQFADWLDALPIRVQRLADDNTDHVVKGYYHWLVSGVDFITLDNSQDDFEPAQMAWLKSLLDRDEADFSVRAIVLGMHEALPDSISDSHSMNRSLLGAPHGRTAADWMVQFKLRSHKSVYVLASHSHFYMDGIFNTKEWLQRAAAPLPGWIIGTAGAVRYALPPNSGDAKAARTNVYGYLLATVDPSQDEPIKFEFQELTRADVPRDIVNTYSPELVDWCWNENNQP